VFPDATCWHEAAHAAVAHALGGRVLELSTECDDHPEEGDLQDGATRVLWPAAAAGDAARRDALTALAGPVGEARFRGEDLIEDLTHLAAAWARDWAVASRHIQRLAATPDAQRAVCQQLVAHLHDWMDDPRTWERIACLADALHAHGTLDEALVAETLGPLTWPRCN